METINFKLSPCSVYFMVSFWVILHVPSYEDGTDCVPKRLLIKFRRRGIIQKKTYNIWKLDRDRHRVSFIRAAQIHYLQTLPVVSVKKCKLCKLTLRRLMSYIYMEHPFLMFLDHTQRHSTVGRTPLYE